MSVHESHLLDLQHPNVCEIARRKANEAYALVQGPVVVEGSGFYVNALGGFPGPYVKNMMQTIGVAGLLKLLEGEVDRTCSFTSALVYQWSTKARVTLSDARSWRIRQQAGVATPAGWSRLWEVLEHPQKEDTPPDNSEVPPVYRQLAIWLDLQPSPDSGSAGR